MPAERYVATAMALVAIFAIAMAIVLAAFSRPETAAVLSIGSEGL